jgi:hypothetical protein
VAAILAGLPFDARSRRALDETMLDWAHEQSTAGAASARALTSVRALAGVARAVAWTVLQETEHAPYGWLAGQMAMFALFPAALMAMWLYAHCWPGLVALTSTGARFELSALLVPHEIEVLLPLMFFLAVACARGMRRLPGVGLALVASALSLVFTGWVEPLANHRFAVTVNALWRPGHPNGGFSGPGVEATMPALVALAYATRYGYVFSSCLYYLFLKTGFAFLAGALAMLGVAVHQTAPSHRRWLLLLAPFIYLGAMELLAGGGTNHDGDYIVLRPRLAPWWLAAIAVVMAFSLLRATRGRRWWLLPPVMLLGILKLILPDDWLFLYRAYTGGAAPWLMAGIVMVITARLSRTVDTTAVQANRACSRSV